MNRLTLARGAATITLGLALMPAAACESPSASAGAHRLRIATGSESGPNHQLGQVLSRIYREGIPDVDTSVLVTSGSVFNIRAMEEGRVDVAFSRADVAYLAFRQGTSGDLRPYGRLRAIAVLHVNAVQILALRERDIRHLGDLQGKRVGIGTEESGKDVTARLILQAAGLEARIVADPRIILGPGSPLRTREVDAGFAVSAYPSAPIESLNAAVGIRLVPIEPEVAGRIRAHYPFFHPIVIPKNTYAGQDEDVPTIGVDGLLLCRRDLPDDLVYQLTRLFMESLARLSAEHPAVGLIDPERSASAPIPLHPGAARFYRERELFR